MIEDPPIDRVDPDRERAPTVTASGARKWLYPDRRKGLFASQRKKIALVLMVVYLVMPWLSWQGTPLLRFDVQHNLIYVFGGIFRFNDSFYFVFVPLFLAVFLFFITAIKGRIWCGYACPQTVFVEWLIRPIEEFFEGPAHKRRRQDLQTWTLELWLRKGAKHFVFLSISAIVANVFLAYFVSPSVLYSWITSPPTENFTPFLFMSFVLGAFYFDLAWFREQFCAFLCPYARFQSVMMDDDTPAVAYDKARGEPRGKSKGKGDCIDCGLCVRVCPTGIDIRDGLQLECIQCNRCIDACDTVMISLKRPVGLIRHSSTRQLGKLDHKGFMSRPRLLIYGSMMLGLIMVFSLHLYRRPVADLKFIRQPGTAYSQLPDGRYANMFFLYASNNSSRELEITLTVEEGNELICGQCSKPLAVGEKRQMNVLLIVDQSSKTPKRSVDIKGFEQTFTVPLLLPQ